MKKSTLIILILLFSFITKAQSKQKYSEDFKKFPQEKIFIHYNSNFLLTGETLYYKIYCLNKADNKNSKNSKIAYVELIDINNKKIIKQKINLKNGHGYSDFFINTDIKSGTYKLISYTQWMKNENSFFESNILIINPFSTKIKNINSTKKRIDTPLINKENTTTPLTITSLKPTYNKREKVSIKFDKKNSILGGKLSLSVKKKNNFKLQQQFNFSNKKKMNNDLLYLPELRGSLIEGYLVSKTQKDISNIKLSLSLKNSSELPFTAVTNKLGEFYFNIPNLNTNKIYIQVLDESRFDYEIKLKEKKEIQHKFNSFPSFHLNKEMIELIKNRSIYLQIENSYSDTKKDSLLNLNNKFYLLNYKKHIYKLDDYKRFNSIKETFIEVIDKASISKNKGKHKIIVTTNPNNTAKTLRNLNSLLIIDGHIIYDQDKFINFDSKKINSISIISDKYFYGNSMYKGIIIIETFDRNYFSETKGLQQFNILKTEPLKQYFFQTYDKPNKTKRVPDYRTQLYWNPDINFSSKEISFFTSDVKGDFEVEIKGFTKKGRKISIIKTFTVK